MPRTKWQPGQSGNPKGRPKGIVDCRMALRRKIEGHADEMVTLAVTAARAGDISALSLLLARAVPPLRPAQAPVQFTLPKNGTQADVGRAIVAAIASGDVAPDVGRQLLDGLASLARLVELDEIERRLAKLEQAQ